MKSKRTRNWSTHEYAVMFSCFTSASVSIKRLIYEIADKTGRPYKSVGKKLYELGVTRDTLFDFVLMQKTGDELGFSGYDVYVALQTLKDFDTRCGMTPEKVLKAYRRVTNESLNSLKA